jgi:nucleoside-diphosphate-sugar epimerase
VHISSVGALGVTKDKEILADEDTKFNWPDYFYYMQSKNKGQKIVEEAIRKYKLKAIILNPAAVMGPGDYNINTPHNQIYQRIYSGFLFGTFSGGTAIVDVRDVCNIILLSIEKDGIVGPFIISGSNVEYKKIIKTIARCLNKQNNILPIKIPSLILILIGFIFEVFGLIASKKPLITFSYGRLSGWYTYYSNSKSKETFMYEYTSFEDTIRDGCSFFENVVLNNEKLN